MRGAVFLALVVLAAACGGGDGASTTGAAQGTAAATTTTTAAPTATTGTAPAPTTTAAPATTTTSPPGPATFDFVVADGSVEGPERIEAALGEEIVIVVAADVSDEVHLHGYDLFAGVTPEEPARLEVVTSIPGIFEVELEGARVVITELEVR